MVHILGTTSRPLMGHNVISFDIPAIQKLYPEFQPRSLPLDTLIWSQLVTPDIYNLTFTKKQWRLDTPADLFSSHSLKAWGYRLGILKGTTPDSSWQTYSPDMLEYCVRDTEVTHALWEELQRWTTSMSAVHLEMQVACIIRMQEETGVHFDVPGAQRVALRLLDERDEVLREIRSHPTFTPVCIKEFIAKVNNKKLGRTKGDHIRIMEDFNPGSNQQLVLKLREAHGWEPAVFTDKGNPKMDDEVLADLAEVFPEVELVRKYLTINKILSYVSTGQQSWLNHVKPDGKIYGRVNSCGAGTRRMTHNSPNLGQVPSAKAYLGKECRSLFLPPPGYTMVGIDADQLELRTLSHFLYPYDGGAYSHAAIHGSKENKDDIHWLNARAFGVDRELGKTVFYASILT
jgi:DNA polymerase-1